MKFMKWLVPLAIVILLLAIALPASAQGPITQVRTYKGPVVVVTAGTNEDPFGGFPIPGSGGIPGAIGIAGKFGYAPVAGALPGGIPSTKSGDATSPRKAINITSTWADVSGGSLPGERAIEIPTCTTVKSPAGSSRWFKAEAFRDSQLIVWLDDELNDATKPSGAAVFGAADAYMWGVAPGDKWQTNQFSDQYGVTSYRYISGPYMEGYVMAVYDPNALQPNFGFPAPNAFILTLSTSGTGSLRRSGTSVGAIGTGVSIGSVGGGPHGYGQWNYGEPKHLLWYDGKFDGWSYVRVYNQMVWDGVISVCSYRHVVGLR
jgi:hypothetical protein